MDRGAGAGSDAKHKDLKDILPPMLTELNNRSIWSLSSCKSGIHNCVELKIRIPRGIESSNKSKLISLPGYGIEQLLDNNTDTYWQSDGPQPHLVNIMFRRKTPVSHLAIYTDLKADESYTPSRISIRTGSHFNDLVELKQLELKDPSGWCLIELSTNAPVDGSGAATGGGGHHQTHRTVKTFMVQLAVLLNHQNGRDTHIRQIKIFGPRQTNVLPAHFAPITSHSCIIR